MKNTKQITVITAACCVLALGACADSTGGSINEAETTQETDKTEGLDTSYEDAVRISLSEYTGDVTIDREGVYVLSGTLSGQVVVDAKDAAVQLILDNVDINCETSAAIYVKKADEVIITLADGSSNVLTDGTEYIYDDEEKKQPNATLYSKADLIINGTGSLTVNANFNNGIKTNDVLTVVSGTLVITAENDGLSANDGLYIEGGDITVLAGDDGVHSEQDLVISGGNITVTGSYEGLEGRNVYIDGGNIEVTASDDGINSAGGSDEADADNRASFGEGSDTHVYINGGTVLVHADGDGIDSNGSIYMTGGTVTVYGPTGDGNGAIDYETGMTLSGGTLTAVGSSGMACAPDSTENQSFIMLNINGGEGEEVIVTDSNNTEITRFTAEKKFSNVVFSSADITEGETYYVSVAGGEKQECIAGESRNGFGHGGDMNGGFQHGDFQPGEKPDGDFQPGDMMNGDFQPGEMKPDESHRPDNKE